MKNQNDPMRFEHAHHGALTLLRETLPRCNNGSCQRVALWFGWVPFYVSACDPCQKESPYARQMREVEYAKLFRELRS